MPNKDLPFNDDCWECPYCKQEEDDKQPMCYNLECNNKKCREEGGLFLFTVNPDRNIFEED